MLKDRIKNLLILIFFMVLFNGFFYYKTGRLNPNAIKTHLLVIVVYIVISLIIYKIKKKD